MKERTNNTIPNRPIFSFAKADRILKRSEFLRLSHSGKKIYTPCFIANICPGTYDRTRIGITVTKKVGNAVLRNRIKRICREFFRLNKHTIAGNWDIVIIAKTNSAILSTRQLFVSLQTLFYKISGTRC